jgi:excisionase family DNA binding protein
MKEMTSAEAAERLGVTPGRIRQLLASGELRSRKVGGTRLISERDLARLEARPAARTGPKPKK